MGSWVTAGDPIFACLVDVTVLADISEWPSLDKFDNALDERRASRQQWPITISADWHSSWTPFGRVALVGGVAELNAYYVTPWPVEARKDRVDSDLMDTLLGKTWTFAKKKRGSNRYWETVATCLEASMTTGAYTC